MGIEIRRENRFWRFKLWTFGHERTEGYLYRNVHQIVRKAYSADVYVEANILRSPWLTGVKEQRLCLKVRPGRRTRNHGLAACCEWVRRATQAKDGEFQEGPGQGCSEPWEYLAAERRVRKGLSDMIPWAFGNSSSIAELRLESNF